MEINNLTAEELGTSHLYQNKKGGKQIEENPVHISLLLQQQIG